MLWRIFNIFLKCCENLRNSTKFLINASRNVVFRRPSETVRRFQHAPTCRGPVKFVLSERKPVSKAPLHVGPEKTNLKRRRRTQPQELFTAERSACFNIYCRPQVGGLLILIANESWLSFPCFFGPFGPVGPFGPYLCDAIYGVQRHIFCVQTDQMDQLDQTDQKK